MKVPKLAVTAIMKNEALYLKEWVEYHHKIGVEKFYLYDNGSTDDTRQVLQEYVDDGLVDIISYPGKCKQVAAYNDSVRKHRFQCQYMAILDCDEFLVTSFDCLFSDVIEHIMAKNSRSGGLILGWRIYGSAHHEKRPDGGVLKNFVYCSADDFEPNSLVKVVVNPRRVFKILNPHRALYLAGYVPIDENGHTCTGGARSHV